MKPLNSPRNNDIIVIHLNNDDKKITYLLQLFFVRGIGNDANLHTTEKTLSE